MIPAGSGGGQNFGWNQREGSIASPVGGPLPAPSIPVYDYAPPAAARRPGAPGQLRHGRLRLSRTRPRSVRQVRVRRLRVGQVWMFDPADPYGTVQNVTSQLPPSAGT